MIAQYVPYAVAAILVVAMMLEVKTGRIPNWLTALPFVLFIVVLVLAEDRWALMPQVYFSLGMFVAGLVLFAVAGFGAGAVKLMTGVVLFIPLSEAFSTLAVFIVALFVCAIIIVQLRKVVGSDDSAWHIWRKPVMPMSLPIGIAGVASLFWL